MNLRHLFLFGCLSTMALTAIAQTQSGAPPVQAPPIRSGCPQPSMGKTAWFDTCEYLPQGNGVTYGRRVSGGEPSYSDPARRAKIKGQVLLAVAINATGAVDAVKVIKPLGSGLDENAVEAVQKWRFTPATKDGTPVAVQFIVEVGFSLY